MINNYLLYTGYNATILAYGQTGSGKFNNIDFKSVFT